MVELQNPEDILRKLNAFVETAVALKAANNDVPKELLEQMQTLVLQLTAQYGPLPWVRKDTPEVIIAEDWYRLQDREKLAETLGITPNYLSSIMSGSLKGSKRVLTVLENEIKRTTGCKRVVMPAPSRS